MRKIKLIWDFRGKEAEHFSEHHAKHLEEFLLNENYSDLQTGSEILNKNHAIAFMVVDEQDMTRFRDILKPHRGEVFK